jgi:hypothetical protein
MNYTKSELIGYSAISAIQATGPLAKMVTGTELDFRPSQPAYEADE